MSILLIIDIYLIIKKDDNYMNSYNITVNLAKYIPKNTTSQSNSVNYSRNLCPDQYVGDMILNANNTWTLQNSNITNRTSLGVNNYNVDYSKQPSGNNILLILESHHIHEFGQNTLPYGPACGCTGHNIDKWINKVFLNSNNFTNKMKQKSYKLILINSVQYQVSCGTAPLNVVLRDKNWISLWNNGFSQDLIDRIKWFNKSKGDIIIINLCTYGKAGLHYYVNQELRNNNILFFEGYHPAINWNIPQRRKIF